jgi:hypothetical protein
VFRSASGTPSGACSRALVDASFGEMARTFTALDLDPVVDRAPARRARRVALYALAALAAVFLLFPATMGSSVGRIVHFRTDFAPPAPFEFIVLPGDVEIVKGESVVLRARTTAWYKPAIGFRVREETQNSFDALGARSDSGGVASVTLPHLRASMVYYAEAQGYRSREYTITVVDRPVVRTMRLTVSFPAYTRLPARQLDDNTGDVAAYPGSTVAFDVVANKDVARAALVFDDSSRLALATSGRSARGTLRVSGNRSYRIALVDEAGIRNAQPVAYTITATPDLAPTVLIEEPGPSSTLDESMRLPVLLRCADDFGYTRLLLHYRLASSRYEQPQESFRSLAVPLPASRKPDMDVPYEWNLAALKLAPEDVLEYYAEVFDNDAVRGPKSGRSQVYTVRLPSIEEVFTQADRTQQKAAEDLSRTLESAAEAQRSLESLQREMKQENAPKMDWQQRKKLEETLARQQKALEEVKRVADDLRKLSEEMQRQNVISPETMQKYEELQQLFQEIDAPELREAIRRMNENMQQMSPEQMRKAMENLQANEDAFRKSIERTIELLKRIRIEQKTDELAKRAEELARKQEDLAERTENADPADAKQRDALAREQEQLRRELEAMQRETAELRRNMEEFPKDMPLQDMQDAESELNQSDLQSQMSESAGQCQGGSCKNASRNQKKTAQQLRRFEQKMSQLKKKLGEDQQKKVMEAFRKTLDDVLSLSKRQEQLKNETAALQQNSQQFREQMQQQAQLMEELNNAANELMELSKKTFAVSPKMGQHLGEAMKKMRQAMEQLQNRSPRSGGEQQGGAMTELNESAREIAQGMQSMKSGGSCSGGSLTQQLSSMAQQQREINSSTKTLGQCGQMSTEQLQRMQRLAQQQSALRKSLQELGEEARRSDEGRRLLGDLDRIAEEMQEVVTDLQQRSVTPGTMERQERILSRMLDASRSMRERDWERRRRAETGRDVVRRAPGALDPSLTSPDQGVKSDLQRAVDEGYSRDYEALIRRYFEGLRNLLDAGK